MRRPRAGRMIRAAGLLLGLARPGAIARPDPNLGLILTISLLLFLPLSVFAVETAPRITDKEIVERLTKVEEGLKGLDKRMDDTNKRIDDLRSEMNGRFDAMNGRFDAMNGRFADTNKRMDDLRSEMNGRFNDIQWMLGLFIALSMVILGFVLRMQWQMNRRMTHVETSLETQKDEMAFLKGLIEKLLPQKGVL